MIKYYAGMDIGGTNGRLKLQDREGTVLGEYTAPGCSVNTDGYEKSRERCRGLVLPAMEALGLKPESCLGVCAAVSGVDSPGYEKMCRDIFTEMGFKENDIRIVNDCEIFLHLSTGRSMVAVSGTGSICYGNNGHGRVFRTGGWNHVLSDEGSAFDLGMQTVRLAAEDLDGRQKCSRLTPMFIEESGLDTLEKIDLFINEHLLKKPEIARFSVIAYEAARQGDAQALQILRECADKIWKLVYDTARKAGWIFDGASEPPAGEREIKHLWLWGSVLVKNEIVREAVAMRVKQFMPEVTVAVPDICALDLALKLAY